MVRKVTLYVSLFVMTAFVWWWFRGYKMDLRGFGLAEDFSSGAMSQLASNQTDFDLYGGKYSGTEYNTMRDNIATFSGSAGNPDLLKPTTYNDYQNRFAIQPRQQIYNTYRPPLTPQMQQAMMMRQMHYNAKRGSGDDWWIMTHIIDPIFALIFKILNNTIGRII